MGRTRAKEPVAPYAAAAEAADVPPPFEHAADESAAESDDSTSTRAATVEEFWDAIKYQRERKIVLGGTPSRPVKEYRKEDVPLAPLNYVPPPDLEGLIPPPRDHSDEEYYNVYLVLESSYWVAELRAWEAFLWRKRRNWEKRNEAAGGTVPPPPPITEHDQLELHTDYLEYVRARVRERENDTDYSYGPSGWFFMQKFELREHLEAVERQVAEMRRERGLDPEGPLAQQQERIEAASPVPGADQVKGKRKREAEDPIGDNSGSQTVKRAKRETPAESPQPQTSTTDEQLAFI